MSETLDVYWGADAAPLGHVVNEGNSTTFHYAVATRPQRQISHSLPVDGGERSHPVTFFENLLPDGVQRERLARRLGVSDASTFAMLRAIGGDCAGALSLGPEGEPPHARGGERRHLDKALVEKMMLVGVIPTALTEGLRLSLAGAQDKLPVQIDGDDVYLPATGTPSTHILKFAGRDFRGVCSNEHFVMSLARAVGLRAARTRLIDLFGAEALLVERFDRSDGRRLHQEDLCQARGYAPSKKYESDGGPTLTDVIRLLDEATTEPADAFAVVRWQAFNIAVGNNDGHAKNLALLREPQVRLAPAYDLVCTRAWEQLDKSLAFKVGGMRDGGTIGPRAWGRFAEEVSLSKAAVVNEVNAIAAAVKEKASDVAARTIEEGADASAVRLALSHALALSTRTLRLMEIEGRNSIFQRARPH